MSMGVPPGFVSRYDFDNLAAKFRGLESAMNRMYGDHQKMANELIRLDTVKDVLSKVKVSGFGGVDGGGRGFKPSNGPMCKAWGGQGYVSVDDIPGRAIPQDFLVDIPVAGGAVNELIGNLYVSMEGPFVATARVAIFRSDYTFRAEDTEGNTASFNGRSNGRFRPISSNSDIMDAVRAFEQISQYQPSYIGAVISSDDATITPVGNPVGVNADSTDTGNLLPNFPGTGRPIVASPLSMSAFRTMSFDALVAVEVAGANFQRQNQRVPSAFWTKNFGSPFDLGALDVFEPGETVTVKVTPTHPNNPAYGNISGLVHGTTDWAYASGTGVAANDPLSSDGPFPYIQGSYDGHEGINDETLQSDTDTTADRITRAENGILTIGYVGYRIVQPPQMAR